MVIRAGEKAATGPEANDARLVFIGKVNTPWATRNDCPHQGRPDGPICRIEIFEPWREALAGIDKFAQIEVLYWLHLARRDLVLQSPHHRGLTSGTFALRSPVRPNPIGTSIVRLVGIEGPVLFVRGLDCLDDTPLIDIKPDRCLFATNE